MKTGVRRSATTPADNRPAGERRDPTTEDTLFHDLGLMRRVAAGQRQASGAVVTRLLDRATRLIGALVQNRADANDVLQDALLEVLRSAGSYKGDAPLERWADRIVVRRAFRFLRANQRRAAYRDLTVEPDETLAAAALRAKELGEALPRPVGEYLRELPDHLRAALVLRHVFGYSVPEVAELSGCSPRRAKKRLFEALRHMREMIDRDLDLPPRRTT